MADTHFSELTSKRSVIQTSTDPYPITPREGDFFFDSFNNRMVVFVLGKWVYRQLTTTTSTSTTTTTTSTSTTTTSTSTSSSTTTSTSTSTSTTTTL